MYVCNDGVLSDVWCDELRQLKLVTWSAGSKQLHPVAGCPSQVSPDCPSAITSASHAVRHLDTICVIQTSGTCATNG